MSFFSYFRLRTAQQVLCVSYSVPAAIFLTTAFSPSGTWSGLWFFNYVVALMALSWGGLALYTRETDRVRQLADSREVTIRNGRRVVVARMKAHEKARLVWEVLLDDDVIRRQLQVWWHGTARFLAFSIRYLPAAVLMTVWLVFWLIPDVAGGDSGTNQGVSGRPCGQVGCGGADLNVCHHRPGVGDMEGSDGPASG